MIAGETEADKVKTVMEYIRKTYPQESSTGSLLRHVQYLFYRYDGTQFQPKKPEINPGMGLQ